jgi:hypothetical protein
MDEFYFEIEIDDYSYDQQPEKNYTDKKVGFGILTKFY